MIDELINYSKKGNRDKIIKLLNTGVDINSQDIFGFTALHEVIEFGHIDLFWELIKKSANIYLKTNDNFTILHAASIGGNSEVIEYLLKSGLNKNEKTIGDDEQSGYTEVHPFI